MLTDTQIKNLKPENKRYKVKDALGLYIVVEPTGTKIWRQRYYWQKKEQQETFGQYPEMSLIDARKSRDDLREQVRNGVNPKSSKINLSVDAKTFKDMFLQWHKDQKDGWSADYAEDTLQRADAYLMPFIGNKPIGAISTPEMRDLLLKIQEKGVLDTLQKIKSIASRVFKYSVGMGVIEVNPVRDLPNDIFKSKPQKNYATITDPKEISWLLTTLDGARGSWQVSKALHLAPYLMLRPGELTQLTWKEIDFDSRLIRVSAEKMKMKKPHLVPMSTQIYDAFKVLSQIDTGSQFVFPTPRNKTRPISTNALLNAIRSLGIDKDTFTTHGFRHMASTRLNEYGFRSDAIERQLAHTDKNKVRATYNHAEHLDERREMMQYWSNYLDELKGKSLNI